MSARQFRETFGEGAFASVTAAAPNELFRVLHITSWWSLAWVSIGFVGQIAFMGRQLVQWVTSEKHRQSIVPPAFWWFSLVGGVMLFSYFVWRQDFVGVLGQSTGIVIYARNLRLIYKHRRRLREEQAARPGADPVGASSASPARQQ
ncbi:MAG: lipid A biosynthesis domain-containing protein [Tepidisphaera sp.]|nr:lipid A biosynthesis domain-containing protein [Tepidisphaera sp.]